jgi:hypothetical protein
MPAETPEDAMQSRNKFLDDLAQLMTNAMGVAQGAREEAETALKLDDRPLAGRPRLRHPRGIRRGPRHGAEGARGERGAEGPDRRAGGRRCMCRCHG